MNDATTDHASAIRAAIDDYIRRRWLVVPIHGFLNGACLCGNPKCRERSRGKHPILDAWQKRASCDPSLVDEWATRWPEMNVGVLLGQGSGIIDIEFDGDEGRAVADKLLGECMTPTFSSGRSIHRLFQWSPELPNVQKVLVAGLEVRIGNNDKGTQSVFPPSRHHSGAEYKWLPGLSHDDVDVQPAPEALMLLLHNDPNCPALPGMNGDAPAARPPEHWERAMQGVAEGDPAGGRDDTAASVAGKLFRNLADVESAEALQVTWQMFVAWNERNRPPLDEKDLKRVFGSILKNEKNRRANEQIHGALPRTSAEQVADATGSASRLVLGSKDDLKGDSGTRLRITESDPPMVEIFSPRFSTAKGGKITLPLGDLLCIPRVQRAAIEQARYILPRFKQAAWEAHLRPLVEAAEIITPPPEATKDGVLAARVLSVLKRLAPDPEGGVLIAFEDLRCKASAFQPAPVSHRDLSNLITAAGAEGRRKDDQRHWYFSKEAVTAIAATAGLAK